MSVVHYEDTVGFQNLAVKAGIQKFLLSVSVAEEFG
jgi:hypothetical protein